MKDMIMVNHGNFYRLCQEGVIAVGEVNYLPSLTIPDQALSLQEMIKRYVSGGSVEAFTPVYTEDTLVPDDWERMDTVERLEHTREMKRSIQKAVRDLSKPAPDPVPDVSPEVVD